MPEARNDEGRIDSTVIIHTRKPQDLPVNTPRGSLGYNYNDRSAQGNPCGSVLCSWENVDDPFGVLTSVTRVKEILSRTGIEFFGYTTGANITGNPAVMDDPNYANAKIPVGINSAYFQQTRELNGLQSTLQWRAGECNESNLNGLHVKGTYYNFSESRYVCPSCGDLNKFTNINGRNTSVNYQNASAANWGFSASPAGSPAGDTSLPSLNQAGGIYYEQTTDRERYTQIDASRDLEWGPINNIQMGVKYINHFNGVQSRGNRVNTTDAISMMDFDRGSIPGGLFDGMHANGDLTDWQTPSKGAVVSYLNSLPKGPYTLNYPAMFDVYEITKDAHLQVIYKSGPWRGNFGVRHVDAEDTSSYYVESDGGTYQRVSNSTHYYKPLPWVNVAYDIDESKVLHLSVAKVIARPCYSDLAGATSLNGAATNNFTADAGNPDLTPYQSTNFGLSAEWYFAPASLLSVEGFVRKIDSYIVTTTMDRSITDPITGLTNVYSVTSPVNASNANVSGLSFICQQDPSAGFGIHTNYTYIKATTHADSTSNTLKRPYLSKKTINIIPYHQHGPRSARISYSRPSPYFTQVGRLNSKVFSDAYKELDLSASYQFNEWIGVTLSATNLLDSTYYQYQYADIKYAPIGEYKSGCTYSMTLDFKL